MSGIDIALSGYQHPSLLQAAGSSVWGPRLAALAVAGFIHLLFLISIPVSQPELGAEQEGIGGIEISLQRLSLPPAPAPAPPKPLPEIKPEPKPQPKPELIQPPKPKPKPKPRPVNKKLPPQPAPKPEPVPAPVAPAAAEPVTTAASDQPASNTPPPVVGGGNPKVRVNYVRKLAAWLERHKRYPNAARRRSQQGTVLLQFTINQQGQLQRHQIVRASEFPLLNEAVEAMIKKASPLPKVPAEIMGDRAAITFTVPVSFKISRR